MPKKKNTASSLNKEKFLIIGAGNMGIAVIKSLFNHRISSKKIVVTEKNQSSELKKLNESVIPINENMNSYRVTYSSRHESTPDHELLAKEIVEKNQPVY